MRKGEKIHREKVEQINDGIEDSHCQKIPKDPNTEECLQNRACGLHKVDKYKSVYGYFGNGAHKTEIIIKCGYINHDLKNKKGALYVTIGAEVQSYTKA